MKADFHLHSCFSDGVERPRDLVRRAAAFGLDLIALTDHDVTDGVPEAREEGALLGVEVLAGVEISAVIEGIDVHLLGIGIDLENRQLQDAFSTLRASRITRGASIVERLRSRGAPITIERVREIAGEGSIGRPHVAHALVESGWARSVDDAFDRWLKRGQHGYVAIEHIEAGEAIRIVHAAGGVVSLAHPPLYRSWRALPAKLASLGLDAIESIHPNIDAEEKAELDRICAELGLLVTGGSDDHGFDSKLHMGRFYLTGEQLDRLLQRIGAGS